MLFGPDITHECNCRPKGPSGDGSFCVAKSFGQSSLYSAPRTTQCLGVLVVVKISEGNGCDQFGVWIIFLHHQKAGVWPGCARDELGCKRRSGAIVSSHRTEGPPNRAETDDDLRHRQRSNVLTYQNVFR